MSLLEPFLVALRAIRASGAAVAETSYYGAVEALLNAAGATLRPPVRCVLTLRNLGAGLPDGGLFAADQLADDAPLPGQLPARGAVEVKGPGEELGRLVAGEQVARYAARYGLVLATTLREWALVGRDATGRAVVVEQYALAPTEAAFWQAVAEPRALAEAHGGRFVDFIQRAMQHAAPLVAPGDVAWFLASYARDALARLEGRGLGAVETLRAALEAALGIRFEGERGDHFFRSTLVQTLFYGLFAGWVLWRRDPARRGQPFEWRLTPWLLHVPMLRALFEQVATPSRLGPLGLVAVLDRAAATLNRVEPEAFFARFEEAQAVQYFYEPFLERFDPALRRQLGVWYTPPDLVRYMVERVDRALRDELGLADGLADPSVYVLDPASGTGAYLVEALHRIAQTLRERGDEALLGAALKQAAMTRLFGFEILPAPFVVAHLQLGLLLQQYGAPLDRQEERVAIFLSNALTGWGDEAQPPLPLPELQEERDAAGAVKQGRRVLVVLGNPPYNGYAGVAVEEERDLSTAYRATRRAPRPQGQGLNDLYVRFFRMAERQIVEGSGRGVVCFVSNYSWLDGLSFTGMRERYLDAFDRIWIDNLNGDKYKTGKVTPWGDPDPSIFSTEWNREGIQVGTAIALLVKRGPRRDVVRTANRT